MVRGGEYGAVRGGESGMVRGGESGVLEEEVGIGAVNGAEGEAAGDVLDEGCREPEPPPALGELCGEEPEPPL